MPNGDLQVDFRDPEVADTVCVSLCFLSIWLIDWLTRCAAFEPKYLLLESAAFNSLGSLETSDNHDPPLRSLLPSFCHSFYDTFLMTPSMRYVLSFPR